MRAWLTVEEGDATPATCELFAGQTATIGRYHTNTVVLRDDLAARWHAVLLGEAGRWFIHTIGQPADGTRVDGVPVEQQHEVLHGQEIAIGACRFRFRIQPAAASAPLPAEDLPALCSFLASAVEQTDVRELLRSALETVVRQTGASVAGFLSLDGDLPVPRLVCPEQATVDIHLSRRLTQQVQQEGRIVWLAGGAHGPLGDSLGGFTDALCVPLRAAGAALGALHVYQGQGLFDERHQRFSELLGGYLASALVNLRARRSLEAENIRLRGRAAASDELVGASPAMQLLRQLIGRAAARSSTVLIRGESGVGKELVALALHRQSARHAGPLVVVNCAAIVATMPEAELFGHTKGAFTGADRDRPGLFQQADEGTLFLDEVGELPADCQAKLLRVIEGQGFRPVGATAERRVDVRIIAATNRDLEEEVRQGRFRRDLLFRLQVIQLEAPPLRQHAEDVPALVELFLSKLRRDASRPPPQLTAAALARLQGHSWPGNVRQLLAVLESAVALTDGPVIDADDLPIPLDAAPTQGVPLNLDDLETWAIRQALKQTRGNISRAARLLGIVRDTLASKMKKKGIDRDRL